MATIMDTQLPLCPLQVGADRFFLQFQLLGDVAQPQSKR